MAEAEKRWGELPPTYTSTSRDDGISGIRIYRIPNGVKLASLVEFPELELGDIEIIQHHHRYVTSWPSMHPDGRQYGWRDPAWSVMDGPPRADDIPELSQTWVEGLAVRPKARGKNKDKPRIVEDTEFVECPYVIERSLTAGEMSAKVAKRLGEATAHCYSDSRHDHILGDTLALLRYGKRGECGVFEAMSTLMKTFAKAVARDRPGGEQEAEDEFMRMLSNEGAARLLSDGDDPDDQVPEDDDAVEPLHGLPHEDYGREFDAPPPSAPLAVARHIYRLFRIDGCRTLLSWRGGWMCWHTTHWSELDAAQLRSHVYRSMSRATYEHVTANGVETRSWNPDKRKVANVIEAMDALAHFPFDIDPPSWVADSAAETEAAQMVSCTNGLFDLSTRRAGYTHAGAVQPRLGAVRLRPRGPRARRMAEVPGLAVARRRRVHRVAAGVLRLRAVGAHRHAQAAGADRPLPCGKGDHRAHPHQAGRQGQRGRPDAGGPGHQLRAVPPAGQAAGDHLRRPPGLCAIARGR